MPKQNHLKDKPRYLHHETRPDLAGEHIWGDFLQLMVFLIFLGVTILDLWLIGSMSTIQGYIPLWIRILISIILFAAAGYLSLYGIRIVFGEYREEPIMITHGMFSVIRHPIYLGALLVYPAVILLTQSVMSIPAWLMGILLYNWLAKDEEERMENLFGEKYRQYMNRVPRWIPRISFSKIRII